MKLFAANTIIMQWVSDRPAANTAVSAKVVPHKRKSERDNADWYYG